MKIIPRSAASWSRNISPCSRVGSSAAISTWITVPSGKTMRGPAGAGGVTDPVVVVGAGAEREQASIATANRRASLFFTFDLHHVVFLPLTRDEVEFLGVVAERAERHLE